MQSSDEASCSDCKLELIQKAWTDLLLKWLHKCVHPDKEVKILTPTCLSDIINKYKNDICENDIDRAVLCTDDIEPFIKYKYPILRLRYLVEASDYEKKQYIMTSVLLFHCCIKSQSGLVHADLCKEMSKYEQEVILKFCERLNDMEITINNIDCAIKEAFDYVKYVRNIPETTEPPSSDVAQTSTDESAKTSYADLPSNGKSAQLPVPPKFNSSVTVLPSVVTDTSTFSDLVTESETSEHKRFGFSDSDEVTLYPVRHKTRKMKQNSDEETAESKHRVQGCIELEIKRSRTIRTRDPCCQRGPYIEKKCDALKNIRSRGQCFKREPYCRKIPEKEPFCDPGVDHFEKKHDSIKHIRGRGPCCKRGPFRRKTSEEKPFYDPCCQPYRRKITEKEPFYDPEIDPFENKRESVTINEPKYIQPRRTTQEEVLQEPAEEDDVEYYEPEEFAVTKHAVVEDTNTVTKHSLVEDTVTKHAVVEDTVTKHAVVEEPSHHQFYDHIEIKHQVDEPYCKHCRGPHKPEIIHPVEDPYCKHCCGPHKPEIIHPVEDPYCKHCCGPHKPEIIHPVEDPYCKHCCGPHRPDMHKRSNDYARLYPGMKPGMATYGDHHPHGLYGQGISSDPTARCLEDCSCTKCMVTGIWCGDPRNPHKEICEGGSKKPTLLQKCMEMCTKQMPKGKMSKKKKWIIIGVAIAAAVIIIGTITSLLLFVIPQTKQFKEMDDTEKLVAKLLDYRAKQKCPTEHCKQQSIKFPWFSCMCNQRTGKVLDVDEHYTKISEKMMRFSGVHNVLPEVAPFSENLPMASIVLLWKRFISRAFMHWLKKHM